MSKERKYQDHEIRQILDLAIGQEDGPAQSLPAADGLTLSQLQEVGREVGLSPDRITHAVAAFEGRGEAVRRGKALGMTTSVGRVVPLPRNLSDREWDLLITELRTILGVNGVATAHGSFREWSHGTVHAFIEPTETGYQLRMANASAAVGGVILGGFIMAFAALIFVVLLGKTNPGFKFAVPAFFGLLGAGLAAGSAMLLPKWVRNQEKWMEHIGRRAVSLLTSPKPSDD
jgi:hypothetical protein